MLKLMGKKNIKNFTLKNLVYLNLWSSLFVKGPVYGFPVYKGLKLTIIVNTEFLLPEFLLPNF